MQFSNSDLPHWLCSAISSTIFHPNNNPSNSISSFTNNSSFNLSSYKEFVQQPFILEALRPTTLDPMNSLSNNLSYHKQYVEQNFGRITTFHPVARQPFILQTVCFTTFHENNSSNNFSSCKQFVLQPVTLYKQFDKKPSILKTVRPTTFYTINCTSYNLILKTTEIT
jgi:hypothetical protein